jgi:hypothetical protein
LFSALPFLICHDVMHGIMHKSGQHNEDLHKNPEKPPAHALATQPLALSH